MKITTISYGRVFSLGNYENEKISIEAEVAEGEDLLKSYVELKQTVEHAHEMRKDLRKYEQAKGILEYADNYTGSQVKSAQQEVMRFNQKYPSLSDTAILPASEVSDNKAHWEE